MSIYICIFIYTFLRGTYRSNMRVESFETEALLGWLIHLCTNSPGTSTLESGSDLPGRVDSCQIDPQTPLQILF